MTRDEFERKIRDRTVVDCFHRLPVRAGDAMFLPSGRVHAIGAGLVIFEIQQNSDTTYRVFDWNRVGLDGKPRELHIAESLASIDFGDFEPSLIAAAFTGNESVRRCRLVQDPLFSVEAITIAPAVDLALKPRLMQIVACLSGNLCVEASAVRVDLSPGGFCLVPACLDEVHLLATDAARLLRIEAS